jgi:hypothetical protein
MSRLRIVNCTNPDTAKMSRLRIVNCTNPDTAKMSRLRIVHKIIIQISKEYNNSKIQHKKRGKKEILKNLPKKPHGDQVKKDVRENRRGNQNGQSRETTIVYANRDK